MPQDFMDSMTKEEIEAPMKNRRLIKEKNATPGDGARSAEGWLDDQRPSFVVPETSTGACSDPATMRTGAIMRHGTLFAQTGKELIPQWHAKYFSQIQPFVIPYMVSGPDYTFFEQATRWRRRDVGGYLQAPWVTAAKFTAGFARRCESQCRQDWSALPIIRSVNFKYMVETMGSLCSIPFSGRQGEATEQTAKKWVSDMQVLMDKLWNGKVRYGNIQVPISGDTTKLAKVEGLSERQRKLARNVSYLATHFPGTQQNRQLMGHCHWGARVNYGDCLFFTISPNEHHSAMVLKLSRYRRNDPCLKHQDAFWKRLCGVDYPALAVERRRTLNEGDSVSADSGVLPDHTSAEHEIVIDLPEYELMASLWHQTQLATRALPKK